jgi:hypothetical protein
MQVQPSSVADLDLIGPDAAEFQAAVESLLGRPPDDLLTPALPYSVIAGNNGPRAVALLGIRFDMEGPRSKPYSVVHYADTLRHPEKAGLAPGAMRFVCAEPLYTDLVLRRGLEIAPRGPMNLDNLRKVLQIRASLDCAAFDDGRFAGPDSLGAFDRLETERVAEMALLAEVLRPDCHIETLLEQAMGHRDVPGGRMLARRLSEAFAAGGLDEVAACARSHRPKIRLWRES